MKSKNAEGIKEGIYNIENKKGKKYISYPITVKPWLCYRFWFFQIEDI